MNDKLDERYQGVSYEPELPDTITLADGREFNIPELLAHSRQNPHSGTIRTLKNRENPEVKQPSARFNAKYTPEETAWLLTATLEQVQERYKVDRKRALAILRYVYSKLGRVYKCPERKTDKRTLAKSAT